MRGKEISKGIPKKRVMGRNLNIQGKQPINRLNLSFEMDNESINNDN